MMTTHTSKSFHHSTDGISSSTHTSVAVAWNLVRNAGELSQAANDLAAP